MSEELQALCFLAGANSIFYGEKLLTTDNPEAEKDRQLFAKLGLVGLGVVASDEAASSCRSALARDQTCGHPVASDLPN